MLSSRKKLYVVLAVIVVLFIVYNVKNNEMLDSKNSNPLDDSVSIFRETKLCAELLDDMKSYEMTPTYQRLFPIMIEEKKKSLTGESEGDSNGALADRVMLHQLARQPWVKTICETGFNYGHSSFNYLSANPKAHVYSFDLGVHRYAKKMNESLHRMFPDKRLHVTFGDSKKTVPKAIESGFLPRCDFIFVDGGHNYPTAKADIENFAMHSNENNLMLFDNWPTKWGGFFGKAWDEVLSGSTLKKGEKIDYDEIKSGIRKALRMNNSSRKFDIKELIRCKDETFRLQRGFVLGTVIKLP